MPSLLDVISNCSQRELRTVSPIARVTVFGRYWTSSAVWTTETIHTDDKEPRYIKSTPRTTYKGSPPVAHIGRASQCVADDHSIVLVRRQVTPCSICHRDIVQGHTRLKSERRDNDNLLVRN